jgi:hypothetical protein
LRASFSPASEKDGIVSYGKLQSLFQQFFALVETVHVRFTSESRRCGIGS